MTDTLRGDAKTYKVCIRSQHSRGGGAGKYGGPDTYVAVQVVPAGAEPLTHLRQDVARRRGIKICYFGEGYAAHTGPTSALGRAIAAAEAFARSR